MNLTGFEKIAPHLANPLVLVGFVLLLAYGIYSQLMKSGLLSKLDEKDSGLIIKLILLLGLLLVLAVLGLVAWNISLEKEKTQVSALSALTSLLEGEFMQAEAAYRNMLQSPNKKLQAIALGNLGILYQIRGELSNAEDMHKKALELDKALNSKKGIAEDYGNLGNVYYTLGYLDKAEKMYKESLTLHEGLGSKEGMAIDYANLGIFYKKREESDKAEELWKKSLSLYQEMNMPDAKKVQRWLDELAKKKAGGSR